MEVKPLPSQIHADTRATPGIDPRIIEDLRHGNIYEILRSGVRREDIESYLAGQSQQFHFQVAQDYEVYSPEGMIRPPDLETDFPLHAREMSLGSEEREFFKQDMQMVRQARAQGASTDEGPGQDVAAIAEKAVADWDQFFSELQTKIIDTQMVREMQSKTADLNRDTQRIVSMVMSGQADPEYVLIAAAKSNLMQNGVLFSWKGKRILNLNERMNKIAKDLGKMNPGDQGYMKELQLAQSQTRSGSTNMQMEMMDIQKLTQNVATTLEWVSSAIKQFAEMRRTPTQNIAAR